MKKLLLFIFALFYLVSLLSCNDVEGDAQNSSVITVPSGQINTDIPDDSRDLEYRLSDDESYYAVCSIGSCIDTNLVIPKEYDGKPVKMIDTGAFANCTDIVTLVIPDSVTIIGEGAFSWCNGLIRVTLGKGVTFIGENAFSDCYKLAEVYNRSSLTVTKGSAGNGSVALYALSVSASSKSNIEKTQDGFYFYKDSSTCRLIGYDGASTELTLPNDYDGTSYEIHAYAFSGNTKITKVTVTQGVSTVGDYAFSGCHSLNQVSLPSGLLSIGSFAFQSCFCLESVSVPDTTLSIGEFAFYSCPILKVIIIPKSVEAIGKNAFSGCMSLTIMTYHTSEPKGWQGFNPNERPVIFAE